jgi:hypothetical protein
LSAKWKRRRPRRVGRYLWWENKPVKLKFCGSCMLKSQNYVYSSFRKKDVLLSHIPAPPSVCEVLKRFWYTPSLTLSLSPHRHSDWHPSLYTPWSPPSSRYIRCNKQ